MRRPNDLQLKIRSIIPSLKGAMRKVGELLAEISADEIADASARGVAKSCGVSEGTVTRFIKLLGFPGFAEFRSEMTKKPSAAHSMGPAIYGEHRGGETALQLCSRVADDNVVAIGKTRGILNASQLERAVDSILSARRIIMIGSGRSGLAAETLGTRLTSLGLTAIFHEDLSQQTITTSVAERNDVAIVFSMSGKVRSNVICAELAKRNGATLINVTSLDDSPIAKLADINLLVAGETPRINDHSFSTILFIIVADCLYMGVYSKLPSEMRSRLLSYRAIHYDKS